VSARAAFAASPRRLTTLLGTRVSTIVIARPRGQVNGAVVPSLNTTLILTRMPVRSTSSIPRSGGQGFKSGPKTKSRDEEYRRRRQSRALVQWRLAEAQWPYFSPIPSPTSDSDAGHTLPHTGGATSSSLSSPNQAGRPGSITQREAKTDLPHAGCLQQAHMVNKPPQGAGQSGGCRKLWPARYTRILISGSA